jgi:hypothetical protein
MTSIVDRIKRLLLPAYDLEQLDSEAERIVSDLTRFRDLHKGQRCFIMGNGPSLNKMDLEQLKDDVVFGLNSCFLIFDRISWRPKYWVAIDTQVIPDRAKRFCKMQAECPEMVMFLPNMLVEHQPGGDINLTTRFLPKSKNRYFFRQQAFTEPLPWGAFSEDINDHAVTGFTVSIAALQIAYYMGFDPVYLIGCDTSYVVPETVKREGPKISIGSPEVTDASHEMEVFLTSTRDDDPNHFDPRYFGKGRKWHPPCPEKMIWHYEQVAAFAKARGWTVQNATVGGKLEAFERIQFESLF